MEVLESLTNILIDIVRTIKFDDGKIAFIREHIKSATTDSFPELRFPSGQDWFNVPNPLSESDLKGKVVVLDFFTFCCINCHHLLPHLKELEEKFPVSDGLVIIGVHSAKFEHEKKSENVALALKKLNVTHPVLNDSNNYMWNRMKVLCWPTIVIIGPNGQALFSLTGEQKKDELFLFVEATLNFYAGELSPHPLPICPGHNIVTSSILKFPAKITRFGNIFAMSDSGNDRILVIDDTGSIKYKIGGKSKGFRNGPFKIAEFNSPQGLAFYSASKIYVADTENHAIRLIDLKKFEVFTVAGTGVQGTNTTGGRLGTMQEISSPWDLCFVSSDQIHISCNNVGLLPPNYALPLCPAPGSHIPPPPPAAFCLPPDFDNVPGPSSQSAFKEDVAGERDEYSDKNVLLIAMSGTHQIWALFLEDTIWWRGKKYRKNVCAAIAGSGREENRNNTYPMLAAFAQPSGLAYSETHNCVFIADSESSSIRKLSLEDGTVSHVVGGDRNPVNLFHFGDVDGEGYDAKLQHPLGLTFSDRENALYVCDTYNNKLKKVDLRTMECVSTDEESNLFKEPSGCVLNEAEEVLYVADTNNHRIATYNLADKVLNNWQIEDTEEDSEEEEEEEDSEEEEEEEEEEEQEQEQEGEEEEEEEAEEEEEEEQNETADIEWELETIINKKGGLLVLTIQLGPEDISGTWKIDLKNTNIESRDLTGTVTADELKMEFKLHPNDAVILETVKIYFNVKFCSEHACFAKKCLLKIVILRTESGEELQEMEFQKTIPQ